jgi:hypothetical protein
MDDTALGTLRRNWGGAYEIGTDDVGRPRARRLDGIGEWIIADTAGELNAKIIDDYTSKPVRDLGTEK